jgi:hypothetical protein
MQTVVSREAGRTRGHTHQVRPCTWYFSVSMSMRLSLAAFNPRSAGSLLPGTVGVSKVPETDLPSVFSNATGNTIVCACLSSLSHTSDGEWTFTTLLFWA